MGAPALADYRKLFVGGEWTPASGAEFPSVDPYHRQAWAVVGTATAEDVDRTVSVARKAFRDWRRMGVYERAKLLFAFADALERETGRLAEIETRDNGKLYK